MDSEQCPDDYHYIASEKLDELFTDLTNNISAKISSDPVPLENQRRWFSNYLFQKQVLFEDPSPEKEFLVIAKMLAYEKNEGLEVTFTIETLSRQFSSPERLPTVQEVQTNRKKDDDEPLRFSGNLAFTRSSRSTETFCKGHLSHKLTEEVVAALQEDGPFDEIIAKTRKDTNETIETLETLAKMIRLGWRAEEASRYGGDPVTVKGNKVRVYFNEYLTVEQAIALHEAINDIMGDDRSFEDRQKIVRYQSN